MGAMTLLGNVSGALIGVFFTVSICLCMFSIREYVKLSECYVLAFKSKNKMVCLLPWQIQITDSYTYNSVRLSYTSKNQ